MVSAVELCVGILAACSATWRPLFSRSIRHSATPTTRCGEAPRHTKITQGKSPNNNPEKIEMTIEMPEGTKAPIRDDDSHKCLHARISEPGTSTDESWYGSKDECC